MYWNTIGEIITEFNLAASPDEPHTVVRLLHEQIKTRNTTPDDDRSITRLQLAISFATGVCSHASSMASALPAAVTDAAQELPHQLPNQRQRRHHPIHRRLHRKGTGAPSQRRRGWSTRLAITVLLTIGGGLWTAFGAFEDNVVFASLTRLLAERQYRRAVTPSYTHVAAIDTTFLRLNDSLLSLRDKLSPPVLADTLSNHRRAGTTPAHSTTIANLDSSAMPLLRQAWLDSFDLFRDRLLAVQLEAKRIGQMNFRLAPLDAADSVEPRLEELLERVRRVLGTPVPHIQIADRTTDSAMVMMEQAIRRIQDSIPASLHVLTTDILAERNARITARQSAHDSIVLGLSVLSALIVLAIVVLWLRKHYRAGHIAWVRSAEGYGMVLEELCREKYLFDDDTIVTFTREDIVSLVTPIIPATILQRVVLLRSLQSRQAYELAETLCRDFVHRRYAACADGDPAIAYTLRESNPPNNHIGGCTMYVLSPAVVQRYCVRYADPSEVIEAASVVSKG